MIVAALTPKIKLGEIEENVFSIIEAVNSLKKAEIAVLPLNIISGDYCFMHEDLIKDAIERIAKSIDITCILAYKIDSFKSVIIENKRAYYKNRMKLKNGIEVAVLDYDSINKKEKKADLACFICSYPYLVGKKKQVEWQLSKLNYKNIILVSGNQNDNNYQFVRSIDKIILSKNKLLASSNLNESVEIDLFKEGRIIDEYKRSPSYLLNDEEKLEALDIIFKGLYYRLAEANCKKVIFGLSGGLDSTIILLICYLFYKKYDFDIKNIICVRMPTLNSSMRTKNNAFVLTDELGVGDLEICIDELLASQLNAINHHTEDVVYENAQARIRSRILLDLANKEGALVLGTSDLTESALGFSTYGGDQLAHYNINKSLTKSAIKDIIAFFIKNNYFSQKVNDCLNDILLTPISPELKKNQKTEDILGSLKLHEFFLLRLVAHKEKNEQILNSAYKEFKEMERGEIERLFNLFMTKFKNNRFKTRFACDGVQLFDYDLTNLS